MDQKQVVVGVGVGPIIMTLLCYRAMNPQFSGNPGAASPLPTCSCNREVLLSDKEAEARSLRRIFRSHPHVSTHWLVGGLNPSEKY